MATNNSLNNKSKNDFLVTSSTSGVERTVTISNTVSNATSQAYQVTSVDPSSTGDSYKRYAVGTTDQYALGIDNSDSDKFILTHGTSDTTPSSSTECITIDTDGRVRYQETVQANAYKSSTSSNVTGNNAYFKVTLDSEEFDVRGSFNTSTNVFTAPVDGKYLFIGATTLSVGDSTFEKGTAILRTGGSTNVSVFTINCEEAKTESDLITLPVIDILSLTASSTVELGSQVSGGGSNSCDVNGSGSVQQTFLHGILLA